jgi:hypothetical protein
MKKIKCKKKKSLSLSFSSLSLSLTTAKSTVYVIRQTVPPGVKSHIDENAKGQSPHFTEGKGLQKPPEGAYFLH